MKEDYSDAKTSLLETSRLSGRAKHGNKVTTREDATQTHVFTLISAHECTLLNISQIGNVPLFFFTPYISEVISCDHSNIQHLTFSACTTV